MLQLFKDCQRLKYYGMDNKRYGMENAWSEWGWLLLGMGAAIEEWGQLFWNGGAHCGDGGSHCGVGAAIIRGGWVKMSENEQNGVETIIIG